MNMDFGEALFLLKAGKRVRRLAWLDHWHSLRINENTQEFAIMDATGCESVTSINAISILADDWQEVEGEKA